MVRHTVFIYGNKFTKISILPKLIYSFKAIPVKMTAKIFLYILTSSFKKL